MADTRRVMHVLEGCGADAELVGSLLAAVSDSEATTAFTLLRGTIEERELLILANLREVLAELPTVPFRTGEALDLLSRAGGYDDTGRSYRRLFETDAGVVGVEFVGRGNQCSEIAVHTPEVRRPLRTGEGGLDRRMLVLFVRHRILLDALLEALGLLGLALEPTIYVTVDDFVDDHHVAAATKAIDARF